MKVTPFQQSFILHFGEMGSRWGINRTVGQIYALLFVTKQALNADEVTDLLGLSRSNVSMGLKELQSWQLIRPQHLPGDRREYFSSPDDVWAIFQILAEQRRQREIDPTLSMLRDALMSKQSGEDDQYAQQRMQEMHDLIELVTTWFGEIQTLDRETLRKLLKMGRRIRKLLDVKNKIGRIGSSAKPPDDK